MKGGLSALSIGCVVYGLSVFHNAAAADEIGEERIASLEHDAEAAAKKSDFAAEAHAYEQLVFSMPKSVEFRLKLADALRNDRRWEQAIAEYEEVLNLQPDNAEAVIGIGTVRRWQGRVVEAEDAYKKASVIAPDNPAGLLGLGQTYVMDHDYASADNVYGQAVSLWPENDAVRQSDNDYRRQRNPMLYLFWESDLSFSTQNGGAIIPFGGREEFGFEYQKEVSFAPELGHAEIYSRSDKKLLYKHYFGLNHWLDFSARSSEYHFNVPDTALEYSSIDTYDEYRVRYTVPITYDQVVSVRYTARPTVLKLSRDRFVAHKVELELRSRWSPRFSSLIGGGWLRDLDSNATSVSRLTDRSLVKMGFQWDVSNKWSLGGKYITNPDLDNTMDATIIGEASYSLTDSWSAIGRYRVDEYKNNSNQYGYYLAARYVPDHHWWSEFGIKYAERGSASGNYGLVSITYRF